ncbi:aspartate aminotransferase family protein [Pelagibius litoralis]|uniref:Aspartate aminotransferase family protein n=1 Tax=Pelagibius litoralis TaxID=374515 RepID=A0A967EV63_9PROT|nr:aspartate aminotransferase family protein [Pelagibius litoralis]NIA67369.1 aspartate aminotransferase family protein [Pelagibius litoralis]
MNVIPPIPNSLEQHWMPFTSNRHFKANPRILTAAKGMYYTTDHGDQVIDGSAGLFCVAAGHGRREIAEAVNETLTTLDYAPPFQYGHPASFEVARRLASITPGDLNHVFFSNSGSEAVESALKIALAYHKAKGEGQRMRLVGRERAYHGVNFGGLTVAGLLNNKKAFGLGLPGACHLRHTELPDHQFVEGQPETGAELAEDLQRFVDLHGADQIACCIVEPIAGSTGALIPPKGYLQRLREICDAHGILLIFDEVICGFGRTGKQFGADAFGVIPDMVTMAKALTNGVVPMGAVACSDHIYETITEAAPGNSIELFHGYTYSGCPVASAAAIATRNIFDEEDLVNRAAKMTPKFQEALFSLRDLPVVANIRGYGLMGGVDLATAEAPGARGLRTTQEFYDAGLIVKMTGDCALISPPLICEDQHIDEIFTKLRDVLSKH